MDDYKGRLRRRLLALRDRLAALPHGVACRLCVVCVRRTSADSDDTLTRVLARVLDDIGKGDDAALKLDTCVANMQSSGGSRDWEMVKKRLEGCLSVAFVSRLRAYDAEVLLDQFYALHWSGRQPPRRGAQCPGDVDKLCVF